MIPRPIFKNRFPFTLLTLFPIIAQSAEKGNAADMAGELV
jgi:hypothetical protein